MSEIDSAAAPQGRPVRAAQAAAANSLWPVRAMLIAMGILLLGMYVTVFSMAPGKVKLAIEEEVQQMTEEGKTTDPAQLRALEVATVWSIQWMATLFMALGVVYILFGFIVYRWPVPITVTALVLFLAAVGFIGMTDRSQLSSGALIKVIILVGLWKSIQAALNHRRQKRAAHNPLVA